MGIILIFEQLLEIRKSYIKEISTSSDDEETKQLLIKSANKWFAIYTINEIFNRIQNVDIRTKISKLCKDQWFSEPGDDRYFDINSLTRFALKHVARVYRNASKTENFTQRNWQRDKKTLDEVVYQKVGFLSNFTHIYVGKQRPEVLSKIKKNLKKNKSKINYPNNWKLMKKNKHYFFKDKKNKIKLNTKNIHSKGLLENLCHAIKIAIDLKIDKKVIDKTIPRISFEGRFQYLKKGKIKNKLHKNEQIMLDGAHAEADAKNLANYLRKLKIGYQRHMLKKYIEPKMLLENLLMI